jgi:hypothetical protein
LRKLAEFGVLFFLRGQKRTATPHEKVRDFATEKDFSSVRARGQAALAQRVLNDRQSMQMDIQKQSQGGGPASKKGSLRRSGGNRCGRGWPGCHLCEFRPAP